jgi:hypothetical protein
MEEKRKSIFQRIKKWWDYMIDAIAKIEIY